LYLDSEGFNLEAAYKDLNLLYRLLQLELERVGLAQTGLLVTKSWPPARVRVFPLKDNHYRAVESLFCIVPIGFVCHESYGHSMPIQHQEHFICPAPILQEEVFFLRVS
jgi:hypothetical protein